MLDSVLIVGDAAGQATPWYCEGIRPALEAGEICGKVISRAYGNGTWSRKILSSYQKEWNSRNRKLYSRNAKIGFRSWFRTQEQWDEAVRHAASHTPEEMLRRVRYSRP
jgi:flavin-dependent dehydrogenase